MTATRFAVATLACIVSIATGLAADAPAPPKEGDIVLTRVSPPSPPGLSRDERLSGDATAVVPVIGRTLNFDTEAFGIYTLDGKSLGQALTRSMARKKDGSTLLGMVYMPMMRLPGGSDEVLHVVLRREDRPRPTKGAAPDAALGRLLNHDGDARIAFEATDPAGNVYRAALPRLSEAAAVVENVEYHGVVTLTPAQVVNRAALLPNAGDVWFNLRIPSPGGETAGAVHLAFAWANGDLETTDMLNVHASRVRVVLKDPPNAKFHLALGNPWWRGQARREQPTADGVAYDLFWRGEKHALKLAHGAVFAQNLLLYQARPEIHPELARQAEIEQRRADYGEFFVALSAYTTTASVLPVPAGSDLKQALAAHHKMLADFKARWKAAGSQPEDCPADPLQAQVAYGLPLTRGEPDTGYGGIGTSSRFVIAAAMTASPDAALMNRLHCWAAFTHPVMCYHKAGGTLRFDNPNDHLQGPGPIKSMPFGIGFLPPLRNDVHRKNLPPAKTWGRTESPAEAETRTLLAGWTVYPLNKTPSVVDLAHHMRSSVYGGQGGVVAACPEYGLYAGAHASLLAHTFGPWSDGPVAENRARAEKAKAASGEMPGWQWGETRSNANMMLHAQYSLLADLHDETFRQAALDGITAWVDCMHAVRHPRGFNFVQGGKYTLYKAADGADVQMQPLLASTYQHGWVENCGRHLLRALRRAGHEQTARRLETVLLETAEKVMASPRVVDYETGGFSFYVVGGFVGQEPASKWSLEPGKRTYTVQGKDVVYDFTLDKKAYSTHAEHHYTAYLHLYDAWRKDRPRQANQILELAAKAVPELYHDPAKVAQAFADGSRMPWDGPAATLLLQRLRQKTE